jgi:hypothetical protein
MKATTFRHASLGVLLLAAAACGRTSPLDDGEGSFVPTRPGGGELPGGSGDDSFDSIYMTSSDPPDVFCVAIDASWSFVL